MRGVAALLAAHADRDPGGVALRVGDAGNWSEVSWRGLAQAVTAAAGGCRSQAGSGPAIVVVDNGLDTMAAVLGALVARTDVLLVERDNSYLTDQGSEVHGVGARVVIGPEDALAGLPERYARVPAGALGRHAVDGAGPGGRRRRGSAVLQLTSGSTGRQRVVRQPVAHVLRGGRLYRDVFGLGPDDTILAAVPLAHSFGLVAGLAACLVTGATLVTLRRFTPRGLAQGVVAGATVLLGTPTVYDLVAHALPASGAAGGGRLRLALSSGGPLPPGVAAGAAARLGVGVHDVYGSTETGLIACQSPRDEPWSEGSVGRPAPGVTVRVAGGGRLWVRTATALTGYADGGPPPPLDTDGFYDTGDLATFVDGDLHLRGRKATFVNVGGRKVNPRRVEDVVRDLEGVRDVAVYGVEAEGGEEVHAAVVLEGGASVADLLTGCRARLAAYEVPHRVHVLDRVPRSAMGKVERARLPR